MFLEFGIDGDGELIRIEQVARGRQPAIFCPYCRRSLIAKKGSKNAAHFAHDGDTCAAAARPPEAIALPVYDRFNLRLQKRELEALKLFAESGEADQRGGAFYRLKELDMVKFNDWRGRAGAWELTKLGKIPVGQLSLDLFNAIQEPMIRDRFDELQAAAYVSMGSADFETALIDLRLYREQWRRILSLTLYFAEIAHTGGTLHKIGVTSRSADERAAEIADDLRGAGLMGVSVKVIGTWAHRGNVELYFKHRYAAHQHPIGTLTEYFAFPDLAPALRDLKRMKAKHLDEFERAILSGEAAPIERHIPETILSREQWDVLKKLPLVGDELIDELTPDEYTTARELVFTGGVRGEFAEFDAPRFGQRLIVYRSPRGQAYVEWFGGFYDRA